MFTNELIKRPASSKFGTAKRSTRPSTATGTIGPGAYNYKSEIERNLEKIRGSVMVGKPNLDQNYNTNPGPGSYQPSMKSTKIRPSSCK